MFNRFENWTDNELRNAIWMAKNGTVPKGGYPREWYEEELYRRTGSRKGFHEEGLTMTFCEMHKNSGGCKECPNRYVCTDSPLKIKRQPK